MPAGRPLQLSSEIIETVLDLMIVIPHLKTIAAHVGVCAKTLRRWFKSGNDEWARRCAGEEPDDRLDQHYHLAKEYAKTGALIMTYHIDFVQQGFPDWRRHAKKLESRFPDEFGSDTRILRRLRRQLAALDEKERNNSSPETNSSRSASTNDPSSLDANSSNQNTTIEETAGTGDKIPFDENASAKRLLESRINRGLRSIQNIDTLGAILREEELLRQFVSDPEQFTNHNFVDVDYFLAQGIERDWRAWTWFLERRFPKEFGPNRLTIRHLKGILAARKILANCKSAGSVSTTDRANVVKIKRKYLNDEYSLESDDDDDLLEELPLESDEGLSIDDLPSESDDDEDSVDDLLSESEEGIDFEEQIDAEVMSTWQETPQLPTDPELWSEEGDIIPDEQIPADEIKSKKLETALASKEVGEFRLNDFMSRPYDQLNLIDQEAGMSEIMDQQEVLQASVESEWWSEEADIIPNEPIINADLSGKLADLPDRAWEEGQRCPSSLTSVKPPPSGKSRRTYSSTGPAALRLRNNDNQASDGKPITWPVPVQRPIRHDWSLFR